MKLFILSLAIVAIASCKSSQSATDVDSVALSPNRANERTGAETKPNEPCLNLNLATARELIKLPGIGEVMAKRIIDYRESHGRFRRPEEIIIIEGFSERKYRTIARMVCTE
jgi:competence ComEA-like helix-hairpin-helix protein